MNFTSKKKLNKFLNFMIWLIANVGLVYLYPFFYQADRSFIGNKIFYFVLGFIIIYLGTFFESIYRRLRNESLFHLIALVIELTFSIIIIIFSNIYVGIIMVCISIIENLPIIFHSQNLDNEPSKIIINFEIIPLLLSNVAFFSLYGYISKIYFFKSLILITLLTLVQIVKLNHKSMKLISLISTLIFILLFHFMVDFSWIMVISVIIVTLAYFIWDFSAKKSHITDSVYKIVIILIFILNH